MRLFNQSLLAFLVVILVAFSESGSAEWPNQKNSTEQEKFWHLVQDISSKLELLPEVSQDIKLSHAIFTQACDTPDSSLYTAESLRLEAEALDKNWGVELRGRLTSEALQNDDDSFGSTQARGYVELSWNVLKNGLRQNKTHANVLHKKADLLELQAQANKIIRTQRCIGYKLDQAFAGYTSQILSLKLHLLESIYPIERRAYFKGWNRYDDLVVTDSELKIARHELNYLHSSPYFDQAMLNIQNPADIDIDMDALILAIRDHASAKQLTQLQKEILGQQKRAADDNQLRFFVRDNIIQNDSFEPTDVVVGLNFIVPFTRDSDKPLLTKVRALHEHEKLQDWERLVKVRSAYQQVRFQQKQLIKQKARFLRAVERTRQTVAEINLSGEKQLLAVAATRLRTALDAGFELIQVRQLLYRKVNQVFQAAGVEVKAEYIRLFATEYAKNKSRVGIRSLYLWSAAFNLYSNQQIIDFLKAKGINEVILSANKKTDSHKLNDFIKQAEKSALLVTTMVGANEWVLPDKHQQAAITSAIAIEKSQRLHLDIEPHTLKGYRENKQKFLMNYLTMIRGVRKAIGNRFLSVSVPVHWPEAVYRQLAVDVDKINIMAYGNSKVAKIVSQLQAVFKSVPADKLVIALNISDYADAWQLENVISQLNKTTDIEQFSLHSFNSLLILSTGP